MRLTLTSDQAEWLRIKMESLEAMANDSLEQPLTNYHLISGLRDDWIMARQIGVKIEKAQKHEIG